MLDDLALLAENDGKPKTDWRIERAWVTSTVTA